MSEFKTASEKEVEKLTKKEYDTALDQADNDLLRFLGAEAVTSFLNLSAPQVEKIQSYMAISNMLEKLTWVSPDKLNEEAKDLYEDGVPQPMLQDMVLLGLANQRQDKYGQASYQPTVKTEEEKRAIYQDLMKRFKDETKDDGQYSSRGKFRVPFDTPFKKRLVKELDQIHGWLTPNEILKIMGHDVLLTDEHLENYIAILDNMVDEKQLEKHKDELFKLKR